MVRRHAIILSFVLATLLATGGVELFYRSLLDQALTGNKEIAQTKTEKTGKTGTKTDAQTATPAPLQLKKTTVRENKEDYTIITKRNLFGKVVVKPKMPPPKVQPKVAPVVPPTSLDLVLLGTISGTTNEQRAIIRDKKTGKQDIYYVGDAIKHALIKEIHRGKIILDVLGEDEVLVMEEAKSPKESAKNRSNTKPEVYSLADVMEKEEKKSKGPSRKRSSASKNKPLKLEKNLR